MLEGLAVPLIVPAIEGREALEGGAIDVRGPLEGGNIDFRAVLDGVFARVELLDEAVEPSCLVGDLLGDFEQSACIPQLLFHPLRGPSFVQGRHLPPTSTPLPASQQASDSQH